MIEGLKPYPAYKESGIPWLGEVPAHWEVTRIGHVGRLLKGVGGTKDDAADVGVPCVRYGDLYTTHRYFIRKARSKIAVERAPDYTPIRFGDVLFAASGETIEEIGKSAVNLMDGAAYCGGDVIILRPSIPVDAAFTGYALDARPSAAQKATMARGTTVKHVYPDQLKWLFLCLPPLPEQAAIVRFLDYVDRRIQRYIRAKEKLIQLLEEQKHAIIHRAVTRGVDPNARLRPSGVEWLGDIPEHWRTSRLKFVASAIVDCLHATPVYSEAGQYPAIRTADVFPGRVQLESARRVDEVQYRRWTARMAPKEGDILFTREGERFGIAALVPNGTRLCISQRMMVFRIKPEHHAGYVMWQINCQHVYAQAAADLIGAAAPHVNVERIRNFWLALPPRREQEKIVTAIEQALEQPEHVAAKARDEISLLREIRTRLIADVVTGKLDVREAAARLPDEAKEPEALDEIELEGGADEAVPDDTDEVLEEVVA